jgi:hypothetical protein
LAYWLRVQGLSYLTLKLDQLLNKFPGFMQVYDPLPCSQNPPLGPIITLFNPHNSFKLHFSKIHFNNISHVGLNLPNDIFTWGFPTIILYAVHLRTTCAAHLMFLDLITLNVTWRRIMYLLIIKLIRHVTEFNEKWKAVFKTSSHVVLLSFIRNC